MASVLDSPLICTHYNQENGDPTYHASVQIQVPEVPDR